MPTHTDAATAQIVYPAKNAAGRYIILTGTAALTAAVAAFATLSLGWAPWIMFMGWVAYFTRPNPVAGLQSFTCVVLGLALGSLAMIAVETLGPSLGGAALPAVVFAVACTVIATRGLPAFNNLLAYFIGLITVFAAHREPSPGTVVVLAAAVALGFIAGWVSQQIEAVTRPR
ncbi:hypothetical protein FHS96_003667 [Sphingomonas zeicaulis]|uniref:DUF1097 domain-containing protein n=1 Tax=Sphingomonas zeicaulis TaxID=1632740 RepID=UPI003D2058D3